MDVSVTITGAMIATTAAYFGKKVVDGKLEEWKARREAWEAHIRTCNDKDTAFALLKKDVSNLKEQIESDRKIRHWIGDCVQQIGAKVNAILPVRPE